MTPHRAVPATCYDLIHEFEQGPEGGPALRAYQDDGGHWTVGWGHLLPPGSFLIKAHITSDTAGELAEDDLNEATCELEHVLGDGVVTALREGEWAALIDFTFNVGIGLFTTSTLCHLVKDLQLAKAAAEFPKWRYIHVRGKPVEAAGLVRRRAAEQNVFCGRPWR